MKKKQIKQQVLMQIEIYLHSFFSSQRNEIKFMKNGLYAIIIFTFLVIIFILPINQSALVDFLHVIGIL